jgi:CheY-like chemotaxis protein
MTAGRRVLLIERDRDVRHVLAERLAAASVDVTIAADARDGLERLRAGCVPQVVLLGVEPRRAGEAFLRALRADPRHADLPVITMDAGAPLRRGRRPREPGLDDLLAIVSTLIDGDATA